MGLGICKNLAFAILNLLISNSAFSQGDVKEIDYENPSLTYNAFDRSVIVWERVDLSGLDWTEVKTNEETQYVSDISFEVSDDIGSNASFVFLAGFSDHLLGWGMLNEEMNGIAKSFKHYRLGNITYIVQAQENLSEDIEKGKYHVRLYVNQVYTSPVYCVFSVSSLPKESIEEIKLGLSNSGNKD